MPSYQEFVKRHGEVATQALLEQMARSLGRNIYSRPLPLEVLWNEIMSATSPEAIAA
jgi:hypothetical protein